MRWVRFFAVICTLGSPACATTAGSGAGGAGQEKRAFRDLSWAEVEAEIARGAVLVDARGAVGYEAGHIPGAINVPAADTAAVERLPAQKDTAIITYCGGPACMASTRLAAKVADRGYTRVSEYRGGYPDWLERHPSSP